ncbi:MAG: hypothetical protein SFY69_00395 [Planctomycetota bacterium]|nr:hypothetical protein [Planctomycetota bacterium]
MSVREAFVGFVLALATTAGADVIPIVNPSFEVLSRPLAVGEQTNGAGGVGVPVGTRYPFGGGPSGVSWTDPVEVPGWRTRLRAFGDPATNYAGVLHPPSVGGQPFITGQDGTNVVAVQIAQMGQTLDALVMPNTRYRLDFLGGIGRIDSDYILSVSLIAVPDLATLPLENEPGVSRLAITQGLAPPRESFGTMLAYTLEFTTPATLPAQWQGKHLGVHMFGSDGIPRVVYDNFRLEATPVPTPWTVLVLAGVLSCPRGRRR